MPNGWRTIKSLVHKIRLHGRQGKGMAESFSREKLRQAPQKEGGWKILCYLLPVWPRLVRPLKSRMNGKKTHTHTLHTISSGCGKERRILIGPRWLAKAALVRNYLEVYWPCAGGISPMNAIGTQLRDQINSGLTRCRMAV